MGHCYYLMRLGHRLACSYFFREIPDSVPSILVFRAKPRELNGLEHQISTFNAMALELSLPHTDPLRLALLTAKCTSMIYDRAGLECR